MAHIDDWKPDKVVVNGDIVNGGPCSLACWNAVQQRQRDDDWHLQRGNHEDYVLEWTDPACPRSGAWFEMARPSFWTFNQLTEQLGDLATLPDRFGWRAADNSQIMAIHASIWGNRDGLFASMSDAELRRRIAPAPQVFVTSHTHEPFIRQIDQTLLVNIGSVGQSCDGDWRASYGRLVWHAQRGWQAEIVRVAYDLAQSKRDYVDSGYLTGAGPAARLTFHELHTARDAVSRWSNVYMKPVLAGEIGLETAVSQFLNDES